MITVLVLAALVSWGWSLPVDPTTPTMASPSKPSLSTSKPSLSTSKPSALQQHDRTEESLKRDITVVAYINNFKNIMTEYVKNQYGNLTLDEVETVRQTIEQFLTDFAQDLRDCIEREENATVTGVKQPDEKGAPEVLEDGLSDSQFVDIKAKIRSEYPIISEEAAHNLVARLRRNLLVTRQKIVEIVRQSQRAQRLNA